MHQPGAIKVNNYQCKNHGVISLACFSCETQEMQGILFYFFSCVCAKRVSWSQAFLAETVETGNKDRDVSQRHALFCEES